MSPYNLKIYALAIIASYISISDGNVRIEIFYQDIFFCFYYD